METEISLIQCDTQITKVSKYKKGTRIDIKGRGGTDFRPVFNYIKKKKLSPNVLVFFTDGYGPAPEKPPKSYIVIWVYPSSGHTKLPWGIHLVMHP